MKRRMRRAAQAGFTLIELMVALVVSGIVVLGIFAFSNIQRSNASAHERNVMIQQALEGSMWTIGQDVRQAGLGFTRTCTELRIWDAASGQLINPGGVQNPASATTDAVTGEHYWVLRDGVQANWRSGADTTMDAAADSLDVILGEANYLGNSGVFTTANIDVAATALTVTTSTLLDNANADHLAQVQQLFPPGSFVIVAPRPSTGGISFSPTSQGQCVLLQVTSDVEAGPDAQEWLIPIDGGVSQFNANLAALFGDFGADPACLSETTPVGCVDDWTDTTLASAMVVPVGRLRWSRYSIDYSIPQLPYLIRSDIIGYQAGDPSGLGGVDYPHCPSGTCTGAGLHLPGNEPPPAAVAIGPMIEDLQVTVGCDGWSIASSDTLQVRYPDPGYEEVGPVEGPLALQPNNIVDENRNLSSERQNDEWLGNSVVEQSAPDCVFYGTAEYNRDAWALAEPAEGPAFRMSPQTLRVTLVASSEADEAAGGLAVADVMAIEDRPALASLVGIRQRFTLSERYSPENLRWRDPRLQ